MLSLAASRVISQLAAIRVQLVTERVVQHRKTALRLRRHDVARHQDRLGEPAPQEGHLEGLR